MPETFFLSIGLLTTSKNTFNCEFQPSASRLGTVVSAVIFGDYGVTGGDGNVRFSIDLELFLTSLYGENIHLRETGRATSFQSLLQLYYVFWNRPTPASFRCSAQVRILSPRSINGAPLITTPT